MTKKTKTIESGVIPTEIHTSNKEFNEEYAAAVKRPKDPTKGSTGHYLSASELAKLK
jgi:hypothetical protein